MESDFFNKVKIIVNDDDNETYHGKKEYISASGLKKIKISPLHFKEQQTKETEALLFGSAYHTYILEPDLFEKEYFIFDPLKRPEPDKTFASNANKEWKNNIYLQYPHVIDADDFKTIKAMKDRLFRHTYTKHLLTKGIAESSHYYEIDTKYAGKVNVKIRPDYLKPKKRIIIDLKTTNDASLDGFTKNAAKYDYHIQASLYADLMEQEEGDKMPWSFIFVAQEKTKPYAFNLFEASSQFISQGRYEYEMLLILYKQCIDNDKWPGYQVYIENRFGINQLSLPIWAIKEINFYNH